MTANVHRHNNRNPLTHIHVRFVWSVEVETYCAIGCHEYERRVKQDVALEELYLIHVPILIE